MEKNTEMKLAAANERMQRIRMARRLLTGEVKELLGHDQTENLVWKGSKVDLMEALYYVYEEETLCDDNGVPMPFARLVRGCCELLHVGLPCNPYQLACRGRQRKGRKHLSYMNRYLMLMDNGMQKPFWKNIVNVLS
jgi:hypothetical protein